MPFVKGDPNINRKGRPRNCEPELLREALKKEGEKRGEDFWTRVAKYAFDDHGIMIAVLKKFVPDSTITTVEGEVNFVIMNDIKINDEPLRFKIGEN